MGWVAGLAPVLVSRMGVGWEMGYTDRHDETVMANDLMADVTDTFLARTAADDIGPGDPIHHTLRDARKYEPSCDSTRSSVCYANLILGFSVNFVHKKRLAERYQ